MYTVQGINSCTNILTLKQVQIHSYTYRYVSSATRNFPRKRIIYINSNKYCFTLLIQFALILNT